MLCWTCNRMAGIQLDPFKLIWLQRLFPAYWDSKRWAFSNFVFRTLRTVELSWSVTIMQCNQVFCSIWQYFSQQEIIFSRLSSFCFLNLHLACVCVGIMLQATARSKAFFSQMFPSESPCHYLGKICCYALYYYHLLKAFLRFNWSVWIMSMRLINLIVSQLEGF